MLQHTKQSYSIYNTKKEAQLLQSFELQGDSIYVTDTECTQFQSTITKKAIITTEPLLHHLP